jgi:hypothetical protein
MDLTIEWTNPLSQAERRRLRNWLDRFPSTVERRAGAIVVHRSDADFAHSFAALTMAVIGRDPLAYALVEQPTRPQVQIAA